jgi:hypothetical protein
MPTANVSFGWRDGEIPQDVRPYVGGPKPDDDICRFYLTGGACLTANSLGGGACITETHSIAAAVGDAYLLLSHFLNVVEKPGFDWATLFFVNYCPVENPIGAREPTMHKDWDLSQATALFTRMVAESMKPKHGITPCDWVVISGRGD